MFALDLAGRRTDSCTMPSWPSPDDERASLAEPPDRDPPAGRGPLAPRAPKLLDRVREQIRTRGYSARTSEAYVGWVRRFVLFHGKRESLRRGCGCVAS